MRWLALGNEEVLNDYPASGFVGAVGTEPDDRRSEVTGKEKYGYSGALPPSRSLTWKENEKENGSQMGMEIGAREEFWCSGWKSWLCLYGMEAEWLKITAEGPGGKGGRRREHPGEDRELGWGPEPLSPEASGEREGKGVLENRFAGWFKWGTKITNTINISTHFAKIWVEINLGEIVRSLNNGTKIQRDVKCLEWRAKTQL